MVYIGIDPGAKGGWSIIYDEENIESFPWDNTLFIESIRELWEKGLNIRCALEKVASMPKQGVVSTWKFAEGYGFIQGVLSSYNISYQLVPPQMWKKAFSLINQDKNKSIEVARKLFPNVNLFPTERCRKPSDGMAESLLIAEYARRHL